MSSLKLRSSKFRHVYGGQTRREHTFENVRITRNTHDSDFCSVNPNFLAVVLESSGGGAFAVLDVKRPGRVDINCPKVCGHAGAVLDVKWNPFNDFVIASASEDTTVKLWTIPQQGLSTVLTEWTADLHGHSRKVAYLNWHPLAENVLMSVGFDRKVMIWNVDHAEPITSLPLHPDTVFSASWGRDGNAVASTCKDKKIRVLDARSASIAVEMPGHHSPKTSKCIFVNDHSIFTTGFSRCSDRQYALWDVRKPGKPSFLQDIDCSSGIVLPYFDPDTNMVYMAGKGDGLIRYVEVQTDPSQVFFLSYYQSPLPQRGLGMMPKRGVDTSKNEVTRFYKLHASKDLVEPIPMIAPRKAEGFQHDIYPPTVSSLASLSADEWTSGINRGPILLNLEDGSILDKPRTSLSAAVQSPIGHLSKMPEITTYKAVKKATPQSLPNHAHNQSGFSVHAPPPTSWRTSPDGLQASPDHDEAAGYHPPADQTVPSSIKNIQRLSMNFELQESQQNTPNHQPNPPPPQLSSAQSMVSLGNNTDLQSSHHHLYQPHHHHQYHHNPSSPSHYNSQHQPLRTASCTVLNGDNNNQSSPTTTHHEASESMPGHTPTWMTSDSRSSPTLTLDPSVNPPFSPTAISPPSPTGHVSVSAIKLMLTSRRSPSPSPSPSPSTSSSLYNYNNISNIATPKPSPYNPATSPSTIGANNAIHVRKVWTPPASPAANLSGPCPANDSELKKAYFRQLGEIKSLQEQVSIKDKRIKDLEAELTRVMTEGAGPHQGGESNC